MNGVRVTTGQHASVPVVTVDGELDLVSVPGSRDELLRALPATATVIDLTGLEFCDSSGVRLLDEVLATAAPGSTLAVRPGSSLDRVLALTGVGQGRLHATVAGAVADLTGEPAPADWAMGFGVIELGDLPVERGGTIAGARLSYRTHGRLNDAGDNCIVYPCSYGATSDDLAWLIGEDGVLDPGRWFVVVPDMFSNGASSSAGDPVHAEAGDWPAVVTIADNVRAQRRLLDHLGVTRVAAVYGFSMGGLQAYSWATLYPELVERAVVVCGSARTAEHNRVFLTGLLSILEAAPEHLGGGRFSAEPVAAKRAFAHVYAGWGLSQDFYRARLHVSALDAPDLETFLQTDWVDRFGRSRAANLYAQAMTWLHADISADERFGGDLPAALASIRARVLLMPSETDLYFRVADNAAELPFLRSAALRPIPSIWGHRAGNPQQNPDDAAFLRDAVRDWLAR